VSPGWCGSISSARSLSAVIAVPSISVITSPCRMPASAAGLFGKTAGWLPLESTMTPVSTDRSRSSASCLVTGW